MSGTDPVRVAVAVPTYRRPDEIAACVPLLLDQVARLGDGAYVVVVDNDPDGSARPGVERHIGSRLRYVLESEPGISAARNRALDEAADADVLAFIDDDERPAEGWLELLEQARREHRAAAVAGTVVSHVEGELDPWIAAGGFFARRHRIGVPTGTPIDTAASNNLLLDLRVVRRLGLRFDPGFGLSGGEDSLFTRSLTGRGERMVWCAEAVVTESPPAARLSRRWVLLRSVSSGNTTVHVEVTLTPRRGARLLVRARYLGQGMARLLAGALRVAFGVALGPLRPASSLRHRARGMRAAARGAGMAAGALGWTYQEYRRRERPTRVASPTTAGPGVPGAAR